MSDMSRKSGISFGGQRSAQALTLAVFAAALWTTSAGAEENNNHDGEAFNYEERSTIESIPFQSVEEEALANTIVEGGLAAPAAGVPTSPAGDDDFYLDPLALQPGDSRTDLGRSEIPAEFRFSNPKSIPGQTHSNNYVIRPPQNRTYDALNVNMTER